MDNKTLSPAIIEKKRDAFVAKYNNEIAKCNKSAWSLAKVVFSTVNDTSFKEVFGNMKGYATALNVSPASITHLTKAYSAREYIRTNTAMLENFDAENIDNMTVSQWQEISAVEEEELVVFFNESEIQSTTATRVIRDMIKDFKALTTNAEENDETPEGVGEELDPNTTPEAIGEEVDNDIMTISYNGNVYYVVDPAIIDKIIELAKSDTL